MQCRRRWSRVTLFAIVATAGATTPTSAYAALDLPKLATELETAKPPRTAEIQNDVVKEVHDITNPLARNDRSKEVRDAFRPLLKAKSPDAQLNAAMIIARLNTIATDSTLIDMLDHPNPAIRYWAAKGLGEIPSLRAVGGHTAAIRAMLARLGKETSGLVKKEIVHSISVLGDLPDLIKVLEVLSTSMQAAMPAFREM